MSSFTGKPIKDVYKDILHTNNSNTGLSTTLKQISCGDGDSTSLSLSQKQLTVKPNADNTSAFLVEDKDGNDLLKVDTSNDKVYAGVNAANVVNTNFLEFNLYELTPVAGTHYPMQVGGAGASSSVAYNGNVNGSAWGGTAANPVNTLTLTSDSHGLLSSAFVLPSDIRIESVSYTLASASATTMNLHVYTYTIMTGSGSTAGNLSSGECVALSGSATDSLVPITVGDDRLSNGTLTKLVTDISASNVLLCFIENVGGTQVTSGKVIVKYHLK